MKPYLRCMPFLALFASLGAGAATLDIDAALRTRLVNLGPGTRLVVSGFPDGADGSVAVTLRRFDVYAPDGWLVAVSESDNRPVPRSSRHHLLGASADGRVRLSLSFDPDGGRITGSGEGPAGPFVLAATPQGSIVRVAAVPPATGLPQGVVPIIDSANDSIPSPQARVQWASAGGKVPTGGNPPLATATIAIDTDVELLSLRFGNDTTAAADWIADLFAAMNVMYQRDLGVALVEGATVLRVGTDPYDAADTPADQTDLDEFGSYWQAHYGAVPRVFAALLSGKSQSPNSASGIAWIDAYCATASQGGGYSVNQVFTNPSIPLSYSAEIVAHELGHNFGAWHTHCTNATTGFAPTSTNTIDQCYSGESSCYSGPTSCPASGPGHPAGTVMSYCNMIGCGGGENVLSFHPAQIGPLTQLIAAATPGCIDGEEIFGNGFD
ncbi:MAG: M12 family metallo-peptidase [Lysobacterales bacterium]